MLKSIHIIVQIIFYIFVAFVILDTMLVVILFTLELFHIIVFKETKTFDIFMIMPIALLGGIFTAGLKEHIAEIIKEQKELKNKKAY